MNTSHCDFMRAGRGGRKKNFRAASESRLKRGEIEVKSESFTPPGEAVATSGAGMGGRRGGGGGMGEQEVEERSPLAHAVM